jgi:hypothetical protein
MASPVVAVELALCHAVPTTADTSYQYVLPVGRAPLVHEVVLSPVATAVYTPVADVFDW